MCCHTASLALPYFYTQELQTGRFQDLPTWIRVIYTWYTANYEYEGEASI